MEPTKFPDSVIRFKDEPHVPYVRIEDCLLTYEDAHSHLCYAGFCADDALRYLDLLPVEYEL